MDDECGDLVLTQVGLAWPALSSGSREGVQGRSPKTRGSGPAQLRLSLTWVLTSTCAHVQSPADRLSLLLLQAPHVAYVASLGHEPSDCLHLGVEGT